MRYIFFLILLGAFNYNSIAQSKKVKNYKLLVTLKNAPFDSLTMLDYSDLHKNIIKGKSVAQYKWEFSLPASVIANSEFMLLFAPDKDITSNSYHQVRFKWENNGKKYSSANIGIQEEINNIEATYEGKVIYEKENVASFLGLSDSLVIGNLICEDFKLQIPDDSSDIKVRTVEPYYGWFAKVSGVKLPYDEQLTGYIHLAKRYPKSRYLLTYLAQNLSNFKSKGDVKSIYQHLDKNISNSKKWYAKIEQYLSDELAKLKLINLDSKTDEPIITNPANYNLIVFSASWCIPCIEEIPVLKKIDRDLGSALKFTYISLDYEKDVPTFKKILISSNISWRTLYAYKVLERIKVLFSIKSIPHSIFVYPNGRMEIMDLRDQDVQKKLYNTLNK